MYIDRGIVHHIRELERYFPVLSVTGPRQAGKTTLLKLLYPDYQYVSLEDPDIRQRAQEDPRGFLRKYDRQVVFDEAQRVPGLFSYIQTLVDEDRQPGRFILSGSQNFLLRQEINQSLAGRAGVIRLFPLDFAELRKVDQLPASYEAAIFQGFYPAHYDTGIPPRLFYPSYVATYLERDVSGLVNAANLSLFQRFLQVCATFAGQLLNYAAIAKVVGVSVPTIQRWVSVLEQSYLVFRLPPYHRNLGKRIIKSPKLYFYDTGLLCYLLGMQQEQDVQNYYQLGALFENLIIAEVTKRAAHSGQPGRFFFYRDSNQVEVDLLEEKGNQITLTEIKAARTVFSKHLKGLNRVQQLIKDQPVDRQLIYGAEESGFSFQEVTVKSWKDL
jgi:uncharacterized protein